MEFKEILNRKIEHYGKTEAAYEFAAEEYANKLIKESQTEQLILQHRVKSLPNRREIMVEINREITLFPKNSGVDIQSFGFGFNKGVSWQSERLPTKIGCPNCLKEFDSYDEAITCCCKSDSEQLPDGYIQLDNAYIEDADNVGSYYIVGRFTKVLVLEKEFNENKCINN